MLSSCKYIETLKSKSNGNYLPIEFFRLTINKYYKIDLKQGHFSLNAVHTLAYGFLSLFKIGELS
jgi:hypothetical protein